MLNRKIPPKKKFHVFLSLSDRKSFTKLNVLPLYAFLQGQSESKKNSKKERANGSVETKGTAMSFGFRKKSAPTSGKKNGNVSTKEKEKITGEDMAVTVIGNRGVLKSNLIENDKNGNSGEQNCCKNTSKHSQKNIFMQKVEVKMYFA